MVDKIIVRQTKESAAAGKVMGGTNTEVLLNGKVLHGARAINFDVDAKSLATITIELFGDIQIEGNFKTKEVEGERKES